jgi:hypothetical protein
VIRNINKDKDKIMKEGIQERGNQQPQISREGFLARSVLEAALFGRTLQRLVEQDVVTRETTDRELMGARDEMLASPDFTRAVKRVFRHVGLSEAA